MAIKTLDKNNIYKRRQLLPVKMPDTRRGKYNSGTILNRSLPWGYHDTAISKIFTKLQMGVVVLHLLVTLAFSFQGRIKDEACYSGMV